MAHNGKRKVIFTCVFVDACMCESEEFHGTMHLAYLTGESKINEKKYQSRQPTSKVLSILYSFTHKMAIVDRL